MTATKLCGTGRAITRMGAPAQFEEGLYEVAPQTYAWMAPNGSWGDTNIGLVDCGGRSVLIDPEGLVRMEAGSGEELLTDVLDLDAVSRVRTTGSFGLNRLLDQFDRLAPALELPMYSGGLSSTGCP